MSVSGVAWGIYHALVIAPIRLVYYIISSIAGFVMAIIQHTVIIPLYLTFNIMFYTPFIKIPLLIPLAYVLELNYTDRLHDYVWIFDQVKLLVTTAVHFFTATIFIGIVVGIIAGVNMSIIEFVFRWRGGKGKKPIRLKFKPKPRTNLAKPAISTSISTSRGFQTTPFLNDLINQVTINEGAARVEIRAADKISLFEDADGYNHESTDQVPVNQALQTTSSEGYTSGANDSTGQVFSVRQRKPNDSPEDTPSSTVASTLRDQPKRSSVHMN